jgi:hypothetical protein
MREAVKEGKVTVDQFPAALKEAFSRAVSHERTRRRRRAAETVICDELAM